MSISAQKNAVRKITRQHLADLSEAEKKLASARICHSLQSLAEVKQFHTIGVFAPLPDEPNIWPVIEEWWLQGVTVAFPRFSFHNPTMTFHCVPDRSQLQPDQNGLLQPSTSEPLLSPLDFDVILVPGLAFDAKGNRLGRGKGYYDRYLHNLSPKVLKVGVCFREQIQDTLPITDFDQTVDVVISDIGVVKGTF